MPKPFKRSDLRSNLSRFLGHDAVLGEALSSHAFGRVARKNGPTKVPGSRRSQPYQRQVVPGYSHSMLAHSATHFRVKVPERPKEAADAKASKQTDGIIGNRPKRGAKDKGRDVASSSQRRHHFIEPPKRGFDRFG